MARQASTKRRLVARRDAGKTARRDDPTAPAPGATAYTVPEVAYLLSCSSRTVWRLIRADRLETFHIGRDVRVSRSALDAFMANGGAPQEAKT
jgi:excisionase family DNA binding protein